VKHVFVDSGAFSATAIANNLTLASANLAHYQRLVPFELSIENWRDPV
jgi:predicted nucleic acid-binding protein